MRDNKGRFIKGNSYRFRLKRSTAIVIVSRHGKNVAVSCIRRWIVQDNGKLVKSLQSFILS